MTSDDFVCWLFGYIGIMKFQNENEKLKAFHCIVERLNYVDKVKKIKHYYKIEL